MAYRKHFIPLESDPVIFTALMHALGAFRTLEFVDICSLELEELAPVPRPVLALILILPTSESYERHKAAEEQAIGSPTFGARDVLWFRQRINNACGLYAILHAVCNLKEDLIGKGYTVEAQRATFCLSGPVLIELLPEQTSILGRLRAACRSLSPDERARYVENLADLEDVYDKAARQGSCEVPCPESEVDFHYVCYVPCHDGNLYELDGDRKGPTNRGQLFGSSEDLLNRQVIDLISRYVERENGCNLQFALMGLVHKP